MRYEVEYLRQRQSQLGEKIFDSLMVLARAEEEDGRVASGLARERSWRQY